MLNFLLGCTALVLPFFFFYCKIMITFAMWCRAIKEVKLPTEKWVTLFGRIYFRESWHTCTGIRERKWPLLLVHKGELFWSGNYQLQIPRNLLFFYWSDLFFCSFCSLNFLVLALRYLDHSGDQVYIFFFWIYFTNFKFCVMTHNLILSLMSFWSHIWPS